MTPDNTPANDGAPRPPWPVTLDVPDDDAWFTIDLNQSQHTASVHAAVSHIEETQASFDASARDQLNRGIDGLITAARDAGAVLLMLAARVQPSIATTSGARLHTDHLTLSWYDSSPDAADNALLNAALADPRIVLDHVEDTEILLLEDTADHSVQGWRALPPTPWTAIVVASSTHPDGARHLPTTVRRVLATLERGDR